MTHEWNGATMTFPEPSTGVKVAKGFAYVLSRIVIVVVVIWVLGVAYQTAVNTMTVNMVVEEAFAKRASYVLTPAPDGSDLAALQKFFTSGAIDNDDTMQNRIYDTPEYTVTGFYARADIDTHLVWSWQTEATVEVTDIVRDIKASSNGEPDATGRLPEPEVPEWRNGVYEVHVIKKTDSEGWIIDRVEFKESVFFEATPLTTQPPSDEAEAPVPTVVVEGVALE